MNEVPLYMALMRKHLAEPTKVQTLNPEPCGYLGSKGT